MDVYGRDRLFVYLRLLSAPEAARDVSVDELERAGHPVVRITVDDPYDLGEKFLRWEFATAWRAPSSASTRSISRNVIPESEGRGR